MRKQQTNPLALATTILITSLFNAVSAETSPQTGKPEPGPLQYGMHIQFALYTFAGKPGESLTPAQFAPTDLNVRSWVQTAKLAGMSFAVLQVKSGSGFCLWDSEDYENDIGHSPVKADIIADFVAACTSEGIEPGVAYSIPDSFNEGERRQSGLVPPPYFSLIKKQVTELYSKYPGIKLQVLDAFDRLSPTQADQLRQIIRRFNPQCIILGDNQGFPDNAYEEATAIKEWVWRPDAHLSAASELYAKYAQCRKDGHALLLNVAPDRTGRIPQAQINVLLQLKSLIANPPPNQSDAMASGTKPAAAERLKKVKALYDQGLITTEEYDKKVKEILDGL